MPFIILDRDGVINDDSDDYIKSPEEYHPIPSSLEAIATLNRAGYCVLVVSNQSGIARGLYDLKTLQRIHDKLHRCLAEVGGKIEEIFFCPHHPDDHCLCRKPKTGLFQQIQEKYEINLAETFFVGDTMTDVQVAEVVGCMPILVMTGKGKKMLEKYPELLAIRRYEDLASLVREITGIKP